MFIEGQKFKQLRDASKNGDESAQKILHAYLHDEDGLDGLLNDYFKPVEEEPVTDSSEPEVEVDGMERADMTGLQKFLADNKVDENSEDYDEYVNEYRNMFPNEELPECKCNVLEELQKLVDDETEAIEGYNNFEVYIVNEPDMCETLKSGMLKQIGDIKNEEIAHIKTLQEMMKNISKEKK